MKENGMYCFVKDYDRNIFEERITELEEELEETKKKMEKYKDMVDRCVEILLPFDDE